MKSTVVLGSPGTGKTSNLIKRIEEEIESGTSKDRIHVVSHTRVAANEIKDRAGAHGINASTIHSMAYRFGEFIKEQVVYGKELKDFSEKLGIPMKGFVDATFDALEVGDEYIAIMNVANNTMLPYEQVYKNSHRPGNYNEFKYFYENYEHWKRVNGFIDFNDMIKVGKYVGEDPIEILFIDEAQDLSKLQWAFLHGVIRENKVKKVIVTGDPDQSLFIWGGADRSGMINFIKDYKAKVVELDQSYRVPINVHRISRDIISRVSNRIDKTYHPAGHSGIIRKYSSADMLDFDDGETLVLYRNHSFRRDIEGILIEKGLPYRVLNGRPGLFENKYSNAIRAVRKIQKMGPNDVVPRSIVNCIKLVATPKAKKILEKGEFSKLFTMRRNEVISFPFSECQYYMGVDVSKEPNILLSSIHGAKGMEADRVILLNSITQRVSEEMYNDPDPEHQVWYVAVTRSKNKLDIVDGYDGDMYNI